ncbi:hypothetical protein Tco_1211332 [Tanacetum coccineum]
MTTPHPTSFPVTTPRAGVFAPLVIISDSDDEITTLPVRPAPPSLDHTPTLYGYPLDFDNESSDEDPSETTESLHAQTASTKEILMPLGSRAAMNQWRAASLSTFHLLLPSEIPSSSSPPPSLLPSSSRKRSKSPSPSLPSSVSPSLPTTTVPPPLEDIESIGDYIDTLLASLASAMQETMTLHARVGSLEKHNMEVRELREFPVTDRLEMAELQRRAQDRDASFWDLKRHFGL